MALMAVMEQRLGPRLKAERLDALAATIRQEHAEALLSARRTLEHVIACGEALMEARNEVPGGQWVTWLAENVGIARTTVGAYIRIATFRTELESAGVEGVQAARDFVRDHDLVIASTNKPLSQEIVLEIRALTAQGLGSRKIAGELGIAKSSVGRVRRGERGVPKDPRKPRKLHVQQTGITDEMIERLAEWMMGKWGHGEPVNDDIRSLALEALSVALGGR